MILKDRLNISDGSIDRYDGKIYINIHIYIYIYILYILYILYI